MRYLIYRWILATYFCFVLVLSLVTAEGCKQISFYAIYLTNWNVILNAASTLLGALLVSLYYQKKIIAHEDDNVMTNAIKVYWVLTTLSTVTSVSLSCVYWPIIYNGRDKGFTDATTHAGNAIMMIIDLYVRAHPPRYAHFVYPLGFGVLYAILFSLPYTLLGGTDRDLNNFIYSVIDWTKHPKSALVFAFGTIVFLVIIHFLETFLATTRCYLHRRIYRNNFTTQNSVSGGNNQGFDHNEH